MVTFVPPVVGPVEGEIAVTVGAATPVSNDSNVLAAPFGRQSSVDGVPPASVTRAW